MHRYASGRRNVAGARLKFSAFEKAAK